MRKMTEENLKAAFAGESQAHMKYRIFADIAAQENKPNLSRLFWQFLMQKEFMPLITLECLI